MINEKDYVSVAEVADIYGVSQPTVRAWVKDGCPVYYERQIKRKTRMVFDLKEVEAYLGLGVRRKGE